MDRSPRGIVVGPRGFEPPTYGSGASAPCRGPPLCLAELRAHPPIVWLLGVGGYKYYLVYSLYPVSKVAPCIGVLGVPPQASLLVYIECSKVDYDRILERLSSTEGVHAGFVFNSSEGPGVLIMWSSRGLLESWVSGGGLDELLSGCRYSYRILDLVGHVHGPAHRGHHH